MDVVTIRKQPPPLSRPVLLAAFRGWNDAGEAASGAAATLRRELKATTFAVVDPEDFFDFQATRPTVKIVDGGSRRIEWPENRFSWARLPGSEGHVVLLNGTEPNLRWRAFTRAIAQLASDLGIERVLTLGALQVDVPHTRPVPVTGSASSPELAKQLGLRRSTYEGPTGITGVLHHACVMAGIESVSLWVGVPHYLAGTPYLAGALAIAERTVDLLGAEVPLERLARDAAAQHDDIAELIADDEDLAEYVTELEERVDAEVGAEESGDLPASTVSGDELAAELERYLRDRRTDG
ncbi:MAG: PAC2 family protein [Euzebyaceae bacterium]|nr:PAC2 family protein [Euzebyaceae bacterium]